MTEQTTPDDGTTKTIYDNNGNVIFEKKMVQSSGFTVYQYDAFNRLKQVGEVTVVSSWPPPSPNTSYSQWQIKHTYDINQASGVTNNYCRGRLTMVELKRSAGSDFIFFVYDKFGNVIENRVSIVGTSTPYSIKFNYDLLGREIETIYPSGNSVMRTYDSAGRLKKIYSL
jgi:YD repeat-containing protein